MAELSSKLRTVEARDGFKRVSYWCPGCLHPHVLFIEGPNRWEWDGNADAPSFSPSVLSRANYPDGEHICHHFMKNGIIQFLGDSTHSLSGQFVPVPDWPSCDD